MENLKLGRIINHDTRSLYFGFDTTGLTIVNAKYERHIPILDQGQLSSCTGNAGIGDLATSPLFETLVKPFYTLDENGAVMLYSDAEKIDGGVGYPPEDVGSSGLSIAKALKNAGLISGFQHTFTLADALLAGSKYPFITGINWYSDMFHPDADGRVHPTGNIVGGHEIEMVEIDADNGRVWFCNSWGSSWGVQGKFYLTWEDFNTLLGQQGDVTVLFPIAITPPAPAVMPTIKLGSTGTAVKTLQTDLNKLGYNLVVDGVFGPHTKVAVLDFQTKHNLVADGIVGPKTWSVLNGQSDPKQAIIDIITSVCEKNAVETILGISVATCESSLNPKATLFNPGSNSTDRGLFQWNSKYHPEITDAMAFDPTEATQLFCNAVKQGNLRNFWQASMFCWKPKLPPEVITKYNL